MIQAGPIGRDINVGQGSPQVVRIMPEVTFVFKDRVQEMADLGTWAEESEAGGSRLCVIAGNPGVGKTTLAVTWINENLHRFGHAQIAVECSGGPGEGRGRGLADVCDRYFDLTGRGPGSAVTASDKARLLTSLLDGQPVVVLLDDARSAADVRPFLSTLPGVLVIVTSRVPLPGLAEFGPRVLSLTPLPEKEVRELFDDMVGAERTGAEPGALAELVRLCAGLPLLASHTAGLLFDDRNLRLAELVRRMTDQGRLAALDAGHDETMVKPSDVFEVLYRELDPPAARLYRAIGLHPVRDFEPELVTALFAERLGEGMAGLRQLAKRGVIGLDRRGRYVMEELTYEHAWLVTQQGTDAVERRQIRDRIADYYLRAAVAASRLLQQRWTLSPLYDSEPPFPLPDFRVPAPDEADGVGGAAEEGTRADVAVVDPVSWTRENLPAIVACMERTGRVWEMTGPLPGYSWQMAEATNAYFTREGPLEERATILALGEQDACHDADAQARIHAQWGEMYLGQNRLGEAEERFSRSLGAAESGSEYRGRGSALEWLGITERRKGNAERALEYFARQERFLDLARPRSRALWQMHRADALTMLGDGEAAMECYRAATGLLREHAIKVERDYVNEGKVLLGQARVLADADRDRARVLLQETLPLFQIARRAREEAEVREFFGDLGDGAGAWQAALDLYESKGFRDEAERVREKLQRK